jgi:hypothetical protein
VAVRTVAMVGWSVFSSQSVSPSELASFMQQFGARPTVFPMGEPEPGSWSVPISDGELVVSEATSDLRTMPGRMIEEATNLLGTAPVYCLSIFPAVGQSTDAVMVEDDHATAALVQRMVNAFAVRWPAVLSDNTTNPMIALGALAKSQTQPPQQEQRRGWKRFLGGGSRTRESTRRHGCISSCRSPAWDGSRDEPQRARGKRYVVDTRRSSSAPEDVAGSRFARPLKAVLAAANCHFASGPPLFVG